VTARGVVRRAAGSLRRQVTTLGTTIGAMWVTFGVNVALGGSLFAYGVIPRNTTGLRGILFAPLLHGNLEHLIANTIPMAILGWLVMLRDSRHFMPVTLIGMLGAGLVSWTLGAPGSVHVGASGVIFGYLGFLMLSGWYARSVGSILLSVGVTALWGGLVVGVLPSQPGVSWQGHLGGFIAGLIGARLFNRRG
jgi:membrane associated rhomboid family serine protease